MFTLIRKATTLYGMTAFTLNCHPGLLPAPARNEGFFEIKKITTGRQKFLLVSGLPAGAGNIPAAIVPKPHPSLLVEIIDTSYNFKTQPVFHKR